MGVKIKNKFNLLNGMVLPKQEASKLLGPHYDSIILCFKDAWKSWEKFGELAPNQPANCYEPYGNAE